MKKTIFFVLGFLIIAGQVFAETVKGPIKSVDAAKSEIVVTDSVSGSEKTVMVHPKIIATLQEGSVVNVSLKPGTSTADTLEVKIG